MVNTQEILSFYHMFDDGEISTERLLAMTADAAGCDVDDVVDALVEEYAPDDMKKRIANIPRNRKRRRNKRKSKSGNKG